VVLLERDDAQEEERKPHAGGGPNNGHYLRINVGTTQTGRNGVTIMALGADMRGSIDDFELVSETDCERVP
jgi:hypothetical protein